MEERPAKLLLKAVRGLPQREQDQVLTALIRSALAEPVWFSRPGRPPRPSDVVMLSNAPSTLLSAGTEMSGPSAMFPVRLPPDLHERLRRWSTDQGFSMAGVVRGLVERFLDEQSGTKTSKRPVAKKPKRATPRG